MPQDAILTIVASYCVAVCAPEQAIANATVANEEDSSKEYQATDGAWFTFQEESD